jgi:hypothetical protein
MTEYVTPDFTIQWISSSAAIGEKTSEKPKSPTERSAVRGSAESARHCSSPGLFPGYLLVIDTFY